MLCVCVCFSPEVREFLGLDNKRNAAEPHDVDPSDQLDDSDVMVRPCAGRCVFVLIVSQLPCLRRCCCCVSTFSFSHFPTRCITYARVSVNCVSVCAAIYCLSSCTVRRQFLSKALVYCCFLVLAVHFPRSLLRLLLFKTFFILGLYISWRLCALALLECRVARDWSLLCLCDAFRALIQCLSVAFCGSCAYKSFPVTIITISSGPCSFGA